MWEECLASFTFTLADPIVRALFLCRATLATSEVQRGTLTGVRRAQSEKG